MLLVTEYLEMILVPPVNREKSEVALMRELTHRNKPKSMERIIEELNRTLRG